MGRASHPSHHVTIVLGIVGLLTLGTDLSAADWPEFRGPGGQGHADQALPTHWSRSENIRWRSGLLGRGWSSPIVSDGRILPLRGRAARRG